jgi:hypothetical protein
MKIRGLDGREYRLKLTGREADPDRPASSGHTRARTLLLALYPHDRVYEEVHLPGAKFDLYVDLLVPGRKLAVEIQGVQHRTFSTFFHGTPAKFREQVRRDAVKRDLLLINGFRFVAIDDDVPGELWPDLLLGRTHSMGVGDGATTTSSPPND